MNDQVEPGRPPDAPRLAPAIERAISAVGFVPAAVAAVRGYGQASVAEHLGAVGIGLVAVLRKGKPSQRRQAIEQSDEFVELMTMADRRRGPHRRAQAPTRLGPSPHQRPRRRPHLVRRRRLQPQRHQDHRLAV